jgi:redox-sensing transcriptional repressor
MRPPRDKIPRPTVRRLSLYLRELELLLAQQRNTISSKQLGDRLSLTDAQVRKDLAYFGQFGHPGIGYRVPELIAELRHILGTDQPWNACIVGAGNIGRALLPYSRFQRKGFHIVAIFDGSPQVVGADVDGHKVRPMTDLKKLVAQRDIKLAIIAVPAESAQSVADQLIDAGVVGILNFAPVRLDVHDQVSVGDVDLSVALEQLAFQASLGVKGSLDERE